MTDVVCSHLILIFLFWYTILSCIGQFSGFIFWSYMYRRITGISTESRVVIIYQIDCITLRGVSVRNRFLDLGLLSDTAVVFSIYIILGTVTISPINFMELGYF